jgi:LytR cell envelope-related transcriptional attenuator
MSSFVPSVDASVSRWRTATIVATALALLELGVLGVIVGTHIARGVSARVQEAAVTKVAGPAPSSAKPTKDSLRPMLTRSETSVLVLNGNGVAGAAAASADRVRRLGYLVAAVGNADTRSATRTLVMYRGRHGREARRLARDVHAQLVTPRELLGAQLVLLLGA